MKGKLPEIFKKRWFRILVGGVTGGVLGYLYYYFIGCQSGGCAITSNPYNSVGFGVILGAVLTY